MTEPILTEIRFRAVRNPSGTYIHLETVIELLNALLEQQLADDTELELRRLTDKVLA
jgi:hypothetical protein